MADQSDGLAQSVRRKLDAGVSVDEVIDELMGHGLSQASAVRFVERARAESAAAASASAASADPIPRTPAPRSYRNLLVGVVAATALIALAWFVYSQRKSAAELAEADRRRADEIRAESRASRETDNDARTGQLDARVDAALTQLQSKSPLTQCQGALQLGRIGTTAQRKVLVDLVYDYSELSSVRICALSAIREMGDTATALGAYEAWARDTNRDLRRAAITGFGEIGPPATADALPHLERELGSPLMDVRYLVVETLGKLGPAADALLVKATNDDETLVRDRATALLNARQTR
jgi:hypothetical protein